jgi:hypothetical protein
VWPTVYGLAGQSLTNVDPVNVPRCTTKEQCERGFFVHKKRCPGRPQTSRKSTDANHWQCKKTPQIN